VRYRFKGFVRSTGQPVEGHAHGETPEEAYQALSEHGIVTESLRAEPESPVPNAPDSPLTSALESALDIASQQVPFDKLADRFKGKNVWVLDRDKIRRRVAQVVDSALSQAMNNMTHAGNMEGVREQVADAIQGLFKDNRNLTSQVSNTSMQLENQIKRIETVVRRAESVMAQMTIAMNRLGTMNFSGGGGGGGPRRFANRSEGGSEQNAVLLEIFKENLRLRGIEIDEAPAGGGAGGAGGGGAGGAGASSAGASGAGAGGAGAGGAGPTPAAAPAGPEVASEPARQRPERPASPLSTGNGPEIQ
jgi:hypothetical protein